MDEFVKNNWFWNQSTKWNEYADFDFGLKDYREIYSIIEKENNQK